VAPLLASMSPSGQTLAVGDYGSNAVTLLDTTTLAVHTVSVTNVVFGLAYSNDGTRLLVCGGNSPLVDSAPGAEHLSHVRTDVVSVLDAVTGGVVATVNVAHDPTAVATGPDGAAYVALGTFPAVARIDPTSLQVSQIGVPALAPVSAEAGSR